MRAWGGGGAGEGVTLTKPKLRHNLLVQVINLELRSSEPVHVPAITMSHQKVCTSALMRLLPTEREDVNAMHQPHFS